MLATIVYRHTARSAYLKIPQPHLSFPNRKVKGKRTCIIALSGNGYLRCFFLVKACIALFQSVWDYVIFIYHGILRIAIRRIISAESQCAMPLRRVILWGSKHLAFALGCQCDF